MKHWIRFFCLSLLSIVAGMASAQDVIEISTVDQLKEFRDAVNSGNTYAGKTVKLTADLDLSGEANWKPIGNLVAYPGQSFGGVFDGNGHSISNLTVNDNTPKYAVAGLFGSVVNGTIKNLTVKNVNITSTYFAGGIVAYTSNAPTIENCHVIGGTIKTTPEKLDNGKYDNGCKAGGIMGYATAGSTINNCTVEGVTISGYRDIGGIVGYSNGNVTNNTVKNVTVTQDLTNAYEGTPNTIGDIIGRGSATLSNNTVIKSDPVAQIGETKYETLAEAVAAAQAGDVIEIIKAGDYTLPNLSKNVTIEGKADGVVSFTHTTAGSVASIPNGATFKNVTFNFGNVNYHGFQHAGTINMEGCTLNGKFFSYADMNFTNCTFDQSNEDYHMWVYGGGTVNYTGCTFNGIGKFLNLYQENGSEEHFVNVDNCTFNSSKNNKAALNVKATCGSTLLQYVVNITKCTTNENFPEASTTDALVVLNGLVQVDDRTADGVDKITVTQDGKKIYPISYVAQIGEGENIVKYETLAEAVAAAQAGDVIEIIKAGDYTLPNLSKNVTIEGKADGVVSFTHTTAGSVASIPNGATFKNVTFNFGNVNYHGFQHAGTINMEGCTLNGKFFSYADMNFTNCTFDQSNEDYHMWVYGGGTVNYTGCTFNGIGKFLNLYQENGSEEHFVNVDNCTFNSSKNNKAALNVKATCGSTLLQYVVNITKCTTNENFPEASTTDALVVLNGLVQVDDRTADGVDKITVTQDGKKIYPVSYVAQIGDVKYTSLAEAFTAATDGQTITVLTDIDLPSTIAVTKQVTLDLSGKTIFNTSDLWVGKNWSFFSVQATGNLTVTGNGTIDAKENDCFTFDVRDGGILTIKDGTFTGNISSVYLINEAGTGVSTCNIEGGTFSIKQIDGTGGYNFLLNCLDASYKNNTAKFNVTGGSFVNFNPANNLAEGAETNFCAAGYEAVQDGDVWTVQKAPVAQIGDVKYTSLAEAFTAATDGQTITVLTDIDLPSTIAVTKQVTLDLSGKTIFNTSDLWVGKNWSFFSVQANGNLTVTGNGTIDAKENDCYTFDVRDGGILTIKDGTFTGNISCVYLINEAGTGVSTCNIEGGTFSIKQLANNVQDDKYRFLLNCYDASYTNNAAKFNVTGGSFVNFNPANNLAEGAETNFCAAGYEAVQDGNVWTVQKAPVAKIGETVYYSLASAIAAVPNDGTETTITLLADVTENAVVKDGKKIVLDLGEKTLTGYIDQYDGELNVKNGTLAGTVYVNGGPASAKAGYNKFTLAADATITSDWGFILYQGPNGNDAYGSVININGTVNGTAWVMGNITEGNSVINVNSGAKIQGSVFGLNGLATLNVKEGATIIGSETGIEVRAGNLNVEGGKISSTATAYEVKANGSGTTTTGAAIAVAQHTTKLATEVTISGGELSGVKTISVADPQNNNLEGVTVKVADALANAETVVIPEGYKWVSVDGISTLTKKEYVAQIGDVKYESLQEAFNAANNDDVVKVLAEVTLSQAAVVPADKTVTLDLNGQTITATSSTIGNMGNLTVVDNAGNGKIVSTGNVAIFVGDNSTTTINSGIIESVEGAVITGRVKGATININGGTLSASDNAVVAGNGSAGFGGNTINIAGGTFNGGIKTAGYVACGIYAPNNDVWNITGGTFNITGGAGVVQRAGTVNISNGVVFNVTGTATGKVGDSRVVVPSAAIVFDSQAAYPGMTDAASMNVSGGTFNAEVDAVASIANEGAATHIAISGGKFTSQVPENCCAPDYIPTTEAVEGYFTVQTKEEAGIFELDDVKDQIAYPYPAGGNAKKITYKRTFSQNNKDKYQSWMVPFNYTITNEDLENFLFYKINFIAPSKTGGVVDDNTKVYIFIEPMKQGDVLKGNKPYVIKPNKVLENYEFVSEGENIKLYPATSDNLIKPISTTAFEYYFYGTFGRNDFKEPDQVLFMYSGNIVWNDENNYLRTYRWFIKPEAKGSDDYAKPNIFIVEGDGDTDGINNAQTAEGEIQGIYTLGGVKVEHPVKGVNIIKYTDGRTKKIYVK